ncbi:MAG TPA: zf-HC2 domain-containing protein [Actinomycetota bacterium]|nr:zf-HC2 domain-containing protein [Actinomycetota bacterium]
MDLSEIDCQEVLRRLELYLDGELDGGLCIDIEEHLVTCGTCTGHSDFQRRLKEILRAKCGCHEVPSQVLQRVRVVIERETPQT